MSHAFSLPQVESSAPEVLDNLRDAGGGLSLASRLSARQTSAVAFEVLDPVLALPDGVVVFDLGEHTRAGSHCAGMAKELPSGSSKRSASTPSMWRGVSRPCRF